MKKLDLKQGLRHLYRPSAKEVVGVDVPTMNFLMVDGEGDPNVSQARADDFGKHHEIYLSDIRKSDPSKWKTIIRQPMRCF